MSSPQTFTRVLSPPLGFTPPNTPPQLFSKTVDRFTSIPWCAKLLSTALSVSGDHIQPIPFIPQGFNPLSPQHDQFVGVTLATPDALRSYLCYFCPDDSKHIQDPTRPITKVVSLFELGKGVCGYKDILHGGMIMTLLDEALGVVVEINSAFDKEWIQQGVATVTGSINVKFLRPVSINSVVCVTAWLDNLKGRKAMIRAQMTNFEGEKMATAESVWVVSKSKI